MRDAEALLEWRNHPDTRHACWKTNEIPWQAHLVWLENSLANPNRRLFIAEQESHPVGTVRADYSGGCWELSWIVAPEARGRGVAKAMVVELASRIQEPIRAEIRPGNEASARIALHAGMVLARRSDGILHFRRRGQETPQP